MFVILREGLVALVSVPAPRRGASVKTCTCKPLASPLSRSQSAVQSPIVADRFWVHVLEPKLDFGT